MRFCQAHWDQLRQKVDEAGLTSLVAETGEQAMASMQRELEVGRSIDTFDPLMGANFAIWSNAMQVARDVGADPLAMMADNPEHPEWQCPICFLNWLSEDHDRNCAEPNCQKERGITFDWMLDRAVQEQAEEWKRLGAGSG